MYIVYMYMYIYIYIYIYINLLCVRPSCRRLLIVVKGFLKPSKLLIKTEVYNFPEIWLSQLLVSC